MKQAQIINLGTELKDLFRISSNFQCLTHIEEKRTLLLYDGKFLYEYNYKKNRETGKINFYNLSDYKTAVNATFSLKYSIYFVLCEDWKLYIFRNTTFDLLNKIPFDSKYSVGMYYMNAPDGTSSDQLVCIGVDSIDYFSLLIETNIHQSKYLSNLKFTMKVDKKESLSENLDWNKGYFINSEGFQQEKLLFVYSLRDIYIHSLEKRKNLYKLVGIAKKENSMTKAIMVKEYKYIVVGYNSGQIRAWKMSNSKKLIHTFEGHTRPIDSLYEYQDGRMFWSASSDMTIRLWNLDLNGSFHQIQLISHNKFIAEHDMMACIGEINNINELLYSFYGKVVKFDKSFLDPSIYKNQGNIKQISFTLDNNSGISLSSEQIRKSDVGKVPVSIFYPPPRSNQIFDIIACPFSPNTYYMLVETGEICRYRLEKDTGIVENSIQTESILDIENHPLSQKATMIKFMKIFPPKVDVEINDIKNLSLEEDKSFSMEELNKLYLENQLLTIGCNKGSVVFVKISNIQQIYARFSFHREKIIKIENLYNNYTKNFAMISICIEMKMKVIQFTSTKANCIRTYDLREQMDIKTYFQRLFSLTQSGELEIWKLNENFDLYTKKTLENTGNDHEQKIISFDILPSKKIIMTASEDQRIKIWNMNKILLCQINIFEKCECVCFGNILGDIIIAHENKLSLIKENHLGISDTDMMVIKQNFNQNKPQIVYFSSYYSKKQETYEPEYLNKKNVKFDGQESQQILKEEKSLQSIDKVTIISKAVNIKNKFNQLIKQTTNTETDFQHNKSLLEQSLVQQQELSRIQTAQDKKKKNRRMNNISMDAKGYQSQNMKLNQPVTQKNQQFVSQQSFVTQELKKKDDSYKKITALPKLGQNKVKADELIDKFTQEKLLNKKILTRRDITLNRIIMRNLIREQLQNDLQASSNNHQMIHGTKVSNKQLSQFPGQGKYF